MDSEKLDERLRAAGCVATSAGVIAVDTQQLIQSYIAALRQIDRLKAELAEATPAPPPEAA